MRLVTIAFALAAAYGQTDRVFQLTQDETRQEVMEIATVIRATADIDKVSGDEAGRTVTVEGTADQIAMADWLIRQLDLPADGATAGVHEFRPASGGDDVLRVFYLAHAQTPQEMLQMVTTLRSVADLPRIFLYRARKAVAVRGTGAQIALADWLVSQLDQATNVAAPAPREYRAGGDGGACKTRKIETGRSS